MESSSHVRKQDAVEGNSELKDVGMEPHAERIYVNSGFSNAIRVSMIEFDDFEIKPRQKWTQRVMMCSVATQTIDFPNNEAGPVINASSVDAALSNVMSRVDGLHEFESLELLSRGNARLDGQEQFDSSSNRE